MLLSIIVPIYNIEIKVFERCINSLKELNIDEYEILLIDDGSKKEYSVLYDEYLKNIKKSNIHIFHKKNGGVSSARNYGLELSNGKYIMFVDSDDEVNTKVINPNILNNDYEYIIFDRMDIDEKNTINKREELNLNAGIINPIDILKQFLVYNRCHTPWGKIIKKDILKKNNILFDEELIQGEDAIFNLNIILQKPKVFYIKEAMYKYYNYNTTVNNRWLKNPDKMFRNYIFLYDNKYELLKECTINKRELKVFSENFIRNIFRLYKKSMKFLPNEKKYLEILDKEIKKIKIKDKELGVCVNLKSKFILFLIKYRFIEIFKFA